MYRIDGRALWTVFNEKALAGLGRDLPTTGRLSPEGVEVALAALAGSRQSWTRLERRERARGGDGRRSRRQRRRGVLQGSTTTPRLTDRVLSGEEEARYARSA